MRGQMIAAAMLLLVPSTSQAATILISLTGTILEQTAPGPEAVSIKIGDKLKLSASIDSDLLLPYDVFGTKVASLYYNGTFSLSLANYTWIPEDEINDGDDGPFGFPLPAVLIRDRKVIGVFGHMVASGGTSPDLTFSRTDPQFTVGGDKFLYMNTYNGPTFRGAWDFDASVAAPEPSTWAMMIAGFGMVGGAIRRFSRTSLRAAAKLL